MWGMGPRARYASAGMPRDPRAGNRLTGQRTRVCPTACGVAEAPPALAAWTIHASLRPSAGRGFGPKDDTDLSRPAAPGSNLPHATFRECGYTLGGASTARLDVGRADADDKHAVRRKAPRFCLARADCQGSLRRHAEGNARGALGPGRLGRLRRGAAALKRVVPAAWRSHPIRLGVVAAAYEVAPRGRARSFAGMRKTVLAQSDRLPTV